MNSVQREKFLQLPALQPPPGVKPNFANPHNIAAAARRTTIVIMVLTSIVVSMRIITKFGIIRRMHLEDYLLIVAWLAFMGEMVPLIRLQDLNIGAHQWEIKYGELIEHLRYVYWVTIISSMVMLLLKAALIVQCLRVFCPPGVRGKTFYFLHILLWGNILLYTTMTLVQLFTCLPVRKAWDVTVIGGRCMDRFQLRTVTAIANTVSDFLIVLVPQKAIWGLSMDRKTKLALSAVFLIGIVACGCAAVPIAFAFQSEGNPDVSYNIGRVGKWTLSEFFCGFVAACLPVLPKLLAFVRKQPMITSINTAVRQLLRVPSRVTADSQESGSYKKSKAGAKGKVIITDVEFHDLVVKTEQSGTRCEPETNSEVVEPDYDSLGFITQPHAKSPV